MLIESRDANVNVVRFERSYSFALRGDAFVFQPVAVREKEKLLERRQNAREAIEIRRPSAFTCRTFPIDSCRIWRLRFEETSIQDGGPPDEKTKAAWSTRTRRLRKLLADSICGTVVCSKVRGTPTFSTDNVPLVSR